MRISREVSGWLSEALPRADAGGPLLDKVDFSGARFGRRTVRFEDAVIGDDARFDDAQFPEGACFANASFGTGASFRNAAFGREADFRGARFGDRASFHGATFADNARFDDAEFGESARFHGARFGTGARFPRATLGAGAVFDAATFGDTATFRWARFGPRLSFRKTTVGHRALFSDCEFGPRSSFSASTIGNRASFSESIFREGFSFHDTAFGSHADLRRSEFEHRAKFLGTRFGDGVAFSQAAFRGGVRFDGARFGGSSSFDLVAFDGPAVFQDVVFGGKVSFTGSTFERTRTFGPVLVDGTLELDEAELAEPIAIIASCRRLTACRTRFTGGAAIGLRWCRASLESAMFPAPSLVFFEPKARIDDEVIAADAPAGAEPAIVSLRGADCTGLAVSDVSLKDCLFAGAHNLAALRIDGTTRFASSPGPRSGRRAIAEEHTWRAACEPGPPWARWSGRTSSLSGAPADEAPVTPTVICSIYRALRKGLEDQGDSPGAADFYYGEMEMRRHNPESPGAERAILTAYWLASGYALRGLRAAIGLLAVIAVFAGIFRLWGFQHSIGAVRATLFSAESTSSLFRIPETPHKLTKVGETAQLVLRLVGPLFFGLLLLSLRGRVKR